MNLCDDGHDEVCYEGKYCPACELNRELLETIEDRNKLSERVEELEKNEM